MRKAESFAASSATPSPAYYLSFELVPQRDPGCPTCGHGSAKCAHTAPGNRCFGPCDRWSDRSVRECPSDTPCAAANGFLDCTGRGPRCTQSRCVNSDQMIPCVNGQEGSPRDCGPGMVCGRSGVCDFIVTPLCGSDDGASGSSSSYTCDGTDFLYCNFAQTTRISCTALGFTCCEYLDRTFTAICR